MPRARNRVSAHARHKKVLARTKGHRGKRHSNYKVAHESMMHALRYSWEHRRKRKGDFRRLWIMRINAASRSHGLAYSRFIGGLKKANVGVNRKLLAQIAIEDPQGFSELVELARA